MDENIKKQRARDILEELKDALSQIIWDDSMEEYNSSRYLIPWMQEDAEYAIKKLNLDKKEEEQFLKLAQRMTGEYTDDV